MPVFSPLNFFGYLLSHVVLFFVGEEGNGTLSFKAEIIDPLFTFMSEIVFHAFVE